MTVDNLTECAERGEEANYTARVLNQSCTENKDMI